MNGNVGINVSNPEERLHLEGNIKLGNTGTIYTNDLSIERETTNLDNTFISNYGISYSRAKVIENISEILYPNWPDYLRLDELTENDWSMYSTIEGTNTFSYLRFTSDNGFLPTLVLDNFGNARIGGANFYTDPNYTLYVDGAAFSTGGWNPSDQRVKENIVNADTTLALDQINNIELKRYDYIDKIAMSNKNTVYGIIAQQVKEVLPESVKITSKIIPNIMQFSESVIIDSDGYSVIKLSVNHNLPIEKSKVKINNNNQNEISEDCEYIIIDSNTFKVKFINKKLSELTSLFIYGYEINDFHNIDKAKIFMPMIGAIQELTKKNNDLSNELTELKNLLKSKNII